MSYSGISVYVDATTIAQEMVKDTELAYQIFQELATIVSDNEDETRFVDDISKNIFEEEDEGILFIFEDIVKAFAHLKETND